MKKIKASQILLMRSSDNFAAAVLPISSYFDPSIHFLFLFLSNFGSQGSAGAVPAVKGREAVYTLDRSPAYCRANAHRQTDIHSHSHLPSIKTDQLIWQACLWIVGGSQSAQTKPTGRTCKLRTERFKDSRFVLQKFLLWGNSANLRTALMWSFGWTYKYLYP